MTARRLLDALGGSDNVSSVSMCMTRLRLELAHPELANYQDIASIHRVLSVRPRGASGVEVVFGPAVVEAIGRAVASLTGRPLSSRNAKAVNGISPVASRRKTQNRRGVRILGKDYLSPAEPRQLDRQDLDHLRELLSMVDEPKGGERSDAEGAGSLKALVINGPNMNLLGLREPGIYGRRSYEDLIDLCREAGEDLGFDEVRCIQSNHEGDIVDAIQDARGLFDGIVMNPAAYTHTSVAILDALKAVAIPCVEVHVSDVPEREDFRQVSYVRNACIACVIGEGLEGYVHALQILAEHLRAKR